MRKKRKKKKKQEDKQMSASSEVTKKDNWVGFRVTTKKKQKYIEQAEELGLTLSNFLRNLIDGKFNIVRQISNPSKAIPIQRLGKVPTGNDKPPTKAELESMMIRSKMGAVVGELKNALKSGKSLLQPIPKKELKKHKKRKEKRLSEIKNK